MKNPKLIESKQFDLDFRDLFKGIIMAVLVPVLVIVQDVLDSGSLIFDWKLILKVAVGGLISYLLKNFLEPTKVIALTGKRGSKKFISQNKVDEDLVGNRPNDR